MVTAHHAAGRPLVILFTKRARSSDARVPVRSRFMSALGVFSARYFRGQGHPRRHPGLAYWLWLLLILPVIGMCVFWVPLAAGFAVVNRPGAFVAAGVFAALDALALREILRVTRVERPRRWIALAALVGYVANVGAIATPYLLFVRK